jgi:hypothetical protein
MLRTAKWLIDPAMSTPFRKVSALANSLSGSVMALMAVRLVGKKRPASAPFMLGHRMRRRGEPADAAAARGLRARSGHPAAANPARVKSFLRVTIRPPGETSMGPDQSPSSRASDDLSGSRTPSQRASARQAW